MLVARLSRYRRYRRIRRLFKRGIGYQILKIIYAMTVGFTLSFALLLLFLVLAYFKVEYVLDWGSIVSIVIAEVPAGVFLWWLLERRESRTRKLLDAVEKMKVQALFKHLEIHYCDKYDSAEYPYLHYYILNTKSNLAFEVSESVQDLVDEGLIKIRQRYRDIVELNRYFDNNEIRIEPRKASGADLSLGD